MTGLPPPAPSSVPPPRVQLPSHEEGMNLPVARTSAELAERRSEDQRAARSAHVGVGLFPAALIVFLVLAFVAIAWTVVAAGGAAG